MVTSKRTKIIMAFQKNTLASYFSRTFVIALLMVALLIPSAVFAYSYGPFTVYGGKIKASYSVLGIGPGVFRVINKEDNSVVEVVSAGSTAGICIGGGWILGMGIKKSRFIYNVIAGCLPTTPK